MPIEALAHYYHERNKGSGDLPELGFTAQKLSYVIEINSEGLIIGIYPCAETTNGKLPYVPDMGTRTGNILCALAWGDQRYLLRLATKSKEGDSKSEAKAEDKAQKCFDFCRELHERLLADAKSEACKALLNFFKNQSKNAVSEYLADCPEIAEKKAVNFGFCYNGEYLHENLEVVEVWKDYYPTYMSGGAVSRCALTGKVQPITRLHPQFSVKGQNTAPLASYNVDSACSYGRKQGSNFPVGVETAHAYGEGLRGLLREQYVSFGDTRIVCWSDDADPEPVKIFLGYINFAHNNRKAIKSNANFELCNLWLSNEACEVVMPADDEEENPRKEKGKLISENIKAVGQLVFGKVADIEKACQPKVPFYVLGLSLLDTNVSVRFFWHDSFQRLCSSLAQQREFWTVQFNGKPFAPAFSSVMAILPNKTKESTLESCKLELLNAFLYNRALNMPTFERFMQADPIYYGDFNESKAEVIAASQRKLDCLRASMIKAFYLQNKYNTLPKEALGMALSLEVTDPAYVLGRILSIAEKIQKAHDPDIQRNVRQRFYKMAIYGSPIDLLNGVAFTIENHLPKLDSGRQGYFKKLLDEAMSKLNACALPKKFHKNQQNLFHLGYYHQSEDMRRPNDSNNAEALAESAEESNE